MVYYNHYRTSAVQHNKVANREERINAQLSRRVSARELSAYNHHTRASGFMNRTKWSPESFVRACVCVEKITMLSIIAAGLGEKKTTETDNRTHILLDTATRRHHQQMTETLARRLHLYRDDRRSSRILVRRRTCTQVKRNMNNNLHNNDHNRFVCTCSTT